MNPDYRELRVPARDFDLNHLMRLRVLRESGHFQRFFGVREMFVRDIMTSAVRMVTPDTDLVAAARIMEDTGIGCLLAAEDGHMAGIVTDRDLVTRGVTAASPPSDITVAEVMTRDPMYCSVDDTMWQAARIMQDNEVRRLPVLGRNRAVAGVLSLGDICRHAPPDMAGALIKALCEPAAQDFPGCDRNKWGR